MYSAQKHTAEGIGWFRGGTNIDYATSKYRKAGSTSVVPAEDSAPKHHYSTLTFVYEFEYDMDTVAMAFAQPYTFTDLQNDLLILEGNAHKRRLFVRETLCRTISGTPCDLLTITSPNKAKGDGGKRGVVLTARVHPGETVGSWMMKGLIEYLLSDEKEAESLRENYVFKIVPMLNPDGVIQGNYRCSLAGCDLNRRYVCPSKVCLDIRTSI